MLGDESCGDTPRWNMIPVRESHCVFSHGGDKEGKRYSMMCDTAWYVPFPFLDGLRNAKPIVTMSVDSSILQRLSSNG